MDQNIPRTNIPQSNGVYKPLLVSVIFIITCSIALFVYHFFLIKYMRWRLQNSVPLPRTTAGTNAGGVEQKLLESIPIIIYSDETRRAFCLEQTECAVCLGELEEVGMVRVLPVCKHPFHVPCIDKWLEGHTSCPLCRASVVESGSDTILELPSELSEGNNVGDHEETNPPNLTTCGPRASMIRHCASMMLRTERMEKVFPGDNLKRSVSMDQFFPSQRNELGLV